MPFHNIYFCTYIDKYIVLTCRTTNTLLNIKQVEYFIILILRKRTLLIENDDQLQCSVLHKVIYNGQLCLE